MLFRMFETEILDVLGKCYKMANDKLTVGDNRRNQGKISRR